MFLLKKWLFCAFGALISMQVFSASLIGSWNFDDEESITGVEIEAPLSSAGFLGGLGDIVDPGLGGVGYAMRADFSNSPFIVTKIYEQIGTSAFSISLWFNTTSGIAEGMLFSTKGTASGLGVELWFENGFLNAAVQDETAEQIQFQSLEPFFDFDIWTHLTAVVEPNPQGLAIHLFLNGQKIEVLPLNISVINGDILGPESILAIGAEINGGRLPFLGQLDEVSLHSGMLTQSQIDCLHIQGFNCIPSDFNEVPGETVEVGIPGPVGPEGPQGEPGPQGEDGVSINDAVVLADGRLQIFLSDGSTITTAASLKGQDGANGKDGVDGESGRDGRGILEMAINSQGRLLIRYDDGSPLADLGSVVGQAGDDGVGIVGATVSDAGNLSLLLSSGNEIQAGSVLGPVGPVGAKGDSVTGAVIDSEGRLVLTISNGSTLSVGNVKGPKGESGEPGLTVTGAQVNAAGNLIVTLSSGSQFNAGYVVGPIGPEGPEGPQGPVGPTGPRGAQGPKGDPAPAAWPAGKYCILANGACPAGFVARNGHMRAISLYGASSTYIKQQTFGSSSIKCHGNCGQYKNWIGELHISACCK